MIDSNKFLNQEKLSVKFDDYQGTITRNYFYANGGTQAIRASGAGFDDSAVIAQNTIEGYYSRAHIDIFGSHPPLGGFHIRKNKFITGRATGISPFGLITAIVGSGVANYKLFGRNNFFTGFDSAAISSFGGFLPLQGDDFGNTGAGSPGNNVFLLPCNSNAKAIKRIGGQAIPAEGNWFGTSTPDSSSLLEGQIDFRPFLTAPPISVSGDICRNSAWGPGGVNVNGDVRIKPGTTLTIEPGTTISLQSNYDFEKAGVDTGKCEIIVEGGGQFVVKGTQANPVKFISSRTEDSAGTNDWQGIVIKPGGVFACSNAVIRHAYAGIEDSSVFNHTIQNVRIGRCKMYGILAVDTDSLTIRGCRVDSVNSEPGGTGIKVHSGNSAKGAKLIADTVRFCYYGIINSNNPGPIDSCLVLGDSTATLVSVTGILHGGGEAPYYLTVANTTVNGYFSGQHFYNFILGRASLSNCYFSTNQGSPRSPVGIRNYRGKLLKVRTSSIYEWGLYGVLTDHFDAVPDLGVYPSDDGYNGLYTSMGGSSWKFVYDSDCGSCSTPIIKAENNQWYTAPPSSRFSPNVDRNPYLPVEPPPKLIAQQEREKENLPKPIMLYQNYPNPFNPTTLIRFNLEKPERVNLEIFNILGQKVRTMVPGEELAAGPYTFLWDGKDDRGSPVSSGAYFYKLRTPTFLKSKKMMLVK
ncbi:MAG TPA: right-handed parallel beta-helix repeat-containing protein [Verrucomicrobiae bacterium]|nr:right-handed parallel beta-helix repeat-containing protein [Verrucomicrobiae bacterium]